jgi:hypothetical protein
MNKKIVTLGFVGAALCLNAGYAAVPPPPARSPSTDTSRVEDYIKNNRPTPNQNAKNTKVVANGTEYTERVVPTKPNERWVGRFTGTYNCAPGKYVPQGSPPGTQCIDCTCGYSCDGGAAQPVKCKDGEFSLQGWERCLTPIDGYTVGEGQCSEVPIKFVFAVEYKKKQENGSSTDETKTLECTYGELCDLGALEGFDESFQVSKYEVTKAPANK